MLRKNYTVKGKSPEIYSDTRGLKFWWPNKVWGGGGKLQLPLW